MELKIFRDAMPQAGTVCTVKARAPAGDRDPSLGLSASGVQTGQMLCKAGHPAKAAAAGRLTLEGYLRCTVYYQGEEGTGLCQTEQKLPFTKQLELPEFDFTAWTAVVEGQTEYLNSRVVNRAAWRCEAPWDWWRPCAPRTKRR